MNNIVVKKPADGPGSPAPCDILPKIFDDLKKRPYFWKRIRIIFFTLDFQNNLLGIRGAKIS